MNHVLLTLAKHPLVWSGLGLLVRYADASPKERATLGFSSQFWTRVGFVSLAVGVLDTVQHGKR